MNPALRGALAAGVAVLVVGFGGSWVYVNLIRDDAPKALTLGSEPHPTTSYVGPTLATGSLDGTWTVTDRSVVGYRATERLFRQDAEAVGRTNAVTGSMTISGTTIESAEFTVDMSKVTSDQFTRDRRFRDQIMDTRRYPTASFALDSTIDLRAIPADGHEIAANAGGKLTLRGITKEIEVGLAARKNGDTISVLTSYRVKFAEWGIDDPSFGPAQVEDNALLEVKLEFRRS